MLSVAQQESLLYVKLTQSQSLKFLLFSVKFSTGSSRLASINLEMYTNMVPSWTSRVLGRFCSSGLFDLLGSRVCCRMVNLSGSVNSVTHPSHSWCFLDVCGRRLQATFALCNEHLKPDVDEWQTCVSPRLLRCQPGGRRRANHTTQMQASIWFDG